MTHTVAEEIPLPPKGETTEVEVNLDQANALMEEAAAVNLDEVLISTVSVAFVEWLPVEKQSVDGQPVTRYSPQVRHAEISDYVPMHLLNRMIAGEKKARRAREYYLAGDENFTQDPHLAWMSEQIFAVWKLTEPDMTQERFQKGLNFDQIQGLFSRFFGGLLRRQRSRA